MSEECDHVTMLPEGALMCEERGPHDQHHGWYRVSPTAWRRRFWTDAESFCGSDTEKRYARECEPVLRVQEVET